MRRQFSPLAFTIALRDSFLGGLGRAIADRAIEPRRHHAIGPGERRAMLCKQNAPRSRHFPHQGKRECARRRRQMAAQA